MSAHVSHSLRFTPVAAVVAFLALGPLQGCAGLEQFLGTGIITPPKVTFLGADLVRAPSQLDLSAYYCPRVVPGSGSALGVAADFVCTRLFGKAPPAEQMQVGFDLRFDVANPNKIPLPLSEILTALTVFPGQSQQNLGAVCLSLCDPNDPSCIGGASNRGCEKAPGDVKSLADFPQAALNVLVAQGIGAAGGQPVGFKLPKVVANANLPVTARLALTPQALLPAMEELARRSINALKAGKPAAFEIPYKMEGTIFASGGSLGRVAAGFGPVESTWPIPTERLTLP
ncbi:MAG TPA: hypothetical protein VGF45_07355 [Polyangia bacterium]